MNLRLLLALAVGVLCFAGAREGALAYLEQRNEAYYDFERHNWDMANSTLSPRDQWRPAAVPTNAERQTDAQSAERWSLYAGLTAGIAGAGLLSIRRQAT